MKGSEFGKLTKKRDFCVFVGDGFLRPSSGEREASDIKYRNGMRKRIFFLSIFTFSLYALAAQDAPEIWADPSYASFGKAKPRQEFISYVNREQAEQRNLVENDHYLPLEGKWRVLRSNTAEGGEPGFYRPRFSVASWGETTVPNVVPYEGVSPLTSLTPPALPSLIPLAQYRAEIDVPYLWLDRDVYLHIEGMSSAYSLYVNGVRVGYSNDTRTPAEYNISPALTDGLNAIGIEVYGYSVGNWMETLIPSLEPGSLGRVYVYSQPKLCIHDFVITTQLDEEGRNGIMWITAVMSNSYRSDEKITLGYDIYAPNGGKLLTYNLQELDVPGQGYDTIICKEYIYPSSRKMWSPDTPDLYSVMLYTRRDGRITEYIPFKVGFNRTEVKDGVLYANGKPVQLSAVNYDAARDEETTAQQLKRLKAHGVNTICVSYPQPRYFYELCDRIGFYVIDQANNNPGYRKDDRNVGGSLANDRAFLPAFIDRASQMQGRSKGYTSLLAISMGGESGNGYNFYKTYQWLKAHDSIHPVTYRDVQGEWNSDVAFPDARDARSFLVSDPPKKTSAQRSSRRR